LRRSLNLTVVMYCAHTAQTIEATRNEAIDKLVDCSHKANCAIHETDADGRDRVSYPQPCPVFRRPA